MKYLLVGAAVLLLVDNPKESELKGTWLVVSVSSNGVPRVQSTATMTFDDTTVKQGSIRKGETYTLNSEATPKQIDLGNGRKGIYELNGDNLKICLSAERPNDFNTGLLIVLKRKK